jgi:hypothetical protein
MPQTVFVSLGPGGDLGWRLLVFVGVALVAGLAMIPRQCPASLSQPLRLGDMAIGSWARAPQIHLRQMALRTVKASLRKLLFKISLWQ